MTRLHICHFVFIFMVLESYFPTAGVFSKSLCSSQVAVIPNCSILAAVGVKMASTPGVSATFFSALAKVNEFISSYSNQ